MRYLVKLALTYKIKLQGSKEKSRTAQSSKTLHLKIFHVKFKHPSSMQHFQ